MTLLYQERNLENINKLADNTKAVALKWHEYCEKNGLQVLVYETIRTEAQQKANVAKGASQTMKSYHLVGQALDFVMVNSKKEALWSGYGSADAKKAIAEAKRLGFEWGGDWTGFVDKPHLQFNYKGYGTDTFGKKATVSTSSKAPAKNYLENGDEGADVTDLQKKLNKIGGYKLVEDGIFGKKTEDAVRDFQKKYKLSVDGLAGKNTIAKLDSEIKAKEAKKDTGIKSVGKIIVDGVKNYTYIYEKNSDKSKKLGQAKKNATYDISGSVKDWYEIIYKEKRAYIKSKYCSKK